MTDVQRCDACGAHNPARAGWCTQCYEPLDRETVPSSASTAGIPPPPASAPTARAVPPTDGLLPLPPRDGPSASDQDGPAAPVSVGGGRFRQAEDGLEWCCEVCAHWNVIEGLRCTVCSAPFLERAPDVTAGRPDVAAPQLLAATVLLPGAGHAMLGMWGQAFFRAVLAVVWGAGGLSLLTYALRSGQPVLPAVPLLLGWFLLVAASTNDVMVAAGRTGRVLLEGRVLLWLVIGVLGATVSSAFVGAMAAVSS